MGFQQKTAITAAVGAFGVSFLLGLIAGVPFGTALTRGLLMSGVFAGIGIGGAILVQRFLPELLESAAPGPEGIDIVLPGDMDDEDGAFRAPIVDADDELIEEVEEVARPISAVHDGDLDDGSPGGGEDGSESLPDLDSLGNSFASSVPVSDDDDGEAAGPGPRSQTISDPELGTFDAREIAQAIRTTLLKDGS